MSAGLRWAGLLLLALALDAGGATAADLPERSVSGQTLDVPEAELEEGLPYYVLPDGDSQILVGYEAPLQRAVLTTSRAVGYVVAPIDLDEDVESPLLAGALRIPVASLSTGSPATDGQLKGPQLLAADEHPEIGVRLLSVRGAERLEPPTDDPTANRFRATARLGVHFRDRVVEIEAPVELTFRLTSQTSFARFVGDMVTIRSSFELSAEQLGLEVPPRLSMVLADSVEIDVFLVASTASPDRSYNPAVSQENHLQESLIATHLRDLDDPTRGYELARAYIAESWDDAEALKRVAFLILADEGVRERNLPLAAEAAARANELAGGDDPLALNSWARAQFEMGAVEQAVAAQKRAVELMGDGRGAERLRENLERYERAARR